jgi:hypothetical protein
LTNAPSQVVPKEPDAVVCSMNSAAVASSSPSGLPLLRCQQPADRRGRCSQPDRIAAVKVHGQHAARGVGDGRWRRRCPPLALAGCS